MSSCSPRSVVVNREWDRFAALYKSLVVERAYRSVDRLHEKLSERVFTCLYREGTGGIVREPEGIATALPGRFLERACSKR